MNEQVASFFQSLQRKPNIVSGHVTAVTTDTTTGGQSQATVAIGSSTIAVPLDALAPRLAMGDQVRLEQYGQAAAAEYRLAGLEAGTRPGAGFYTVLDSTLLGGAVYAGGDVIFGKLAGGNMFVEHATGRLYHRIGLEVYGIEYPGGQQFIGHASLAGGDYVADGPNVLIETTGISLRNAQVPAITLDTGGVVWANSTLRAGSGNTTVALNATDATWRLYVGHATPASAPFRVDKDGALTATNATITGTITSTSGTIGGWTLGATALTAGSAGTTVGLDSGGTNPAFYAGSATPVSAPFRVTNAGALTATNATVAGTLTATAGTITGDFYVGAANPRILISGTETNKYITSTNFASGAAGFRIEGLTGNAEFNNITARGTIKTVVFEKSMVSAFAGSQIVAKSASSIFEDCVVSGATFTLKVLKQSGAAPFADTDIVRIKTESSDTWATVNAGTDGTTHWNYTATYESGSTPVIVPAGQAVVDYGQSGQGYYIISADGLLGASAAWALRSHAGAPWTTETTHVYAGTDGLLYAGGGAISLSESGIAIANSAAAAGYVQWYNSAAENIGQIWVYTESSPLSNYLGINANADSTQIQFGLKADYTNDRVYAEIIKNSVMSDFAGLIVGGIGGDVPAATLEVVGNGNFLNGLIVNESGADSDTRIEGDTDANLIFVDAGADKVGIGTAAPTLLFSVAEKVGLTPEGGLAVLVVAGEALSRGNIVYVKLASGADGKVWKTVYSDGDAIQMPIGFVYADAAADANVWIVTNGIAYGLPETGITAARGNVVIVSNAESGRVEQSASTPVAEHWRECGHWLDTGSGNGALTRLLIHFN